MTFFIGWLLAIVGLSIWRAHSLIRRWTKIANHELGLMTGVRGNELHLVNDLRMNPIFSKFAALTNGWNLSQVFISRWLIQFPAGCIINIINPINWLIVLPGAIIGAVIF